MGVTRKAESDRGAPRLTVWRTGWGPQPADHHHLGTLQYSLLALLPLPQGKLT